MGMPIVLSWPATVAIWKARNGKVSGRGLVLPSTINVIVPTGAPEIVKCPSALVRA
jgi:hypothetical protein